MEVCVNRLLLVVSAILLVVGCGAPRPTGPTPVPTNPPLTKLTVGLGYIPSVQFAQFNRAKVQGYYEDAGLDVTFQNGDDANLIMLIAQGADDIGIADGTSVIPAVGQNIPIVYVATIYAKFPNVVICHTASGVSRAADLHGKTIGIPGAYGSSWIMLQALLESAGLTTANIIERDYPDYGQGVALQQGQVQCATAFRNNEPVQLSLAGFKTTALAVDDFVPLPGPGLIVSKSTLDAKRDELVLFIEATLRAMQEIDADPNVGLDDAIAYVPELGTVTDRATQLAILQATIDMWHPKNGGANTFGAIDQGAWSDSLSFMKTLPDSNIPDNVTVESLIYKGLLP